MYHLLADILTRLFGVLVLFLLLAPGYARHMRTNRKYVSGTGWCVWRWTDVRTEYITRLHVFKTPWFAVCLHWLNTPDPDPHLHDHPVSFLSIFLRGWYEELRADGKECASYRRHRWFNFLHTYSRHRITEVRPYTVTLCFMGPKTQEWGFFTLQGKVHWKDYYKQQEVKHG